jgi:hypothetical protein
MFEWAQGLGFDLMPPSEPPPTSLVAQFIQKVLITFQQDREGCERLWRDYCAPIAVEDFQDEAQRDLAWFKLFLFAGAHSVGYGRAATASRFVHWCEENGILRIMLKHQPNPEDRTAGSEAWIQLLWQQVEASGEYHDYTFRTLFAQMFRISAYLAPYRDHFLAFQDWPASQALHPSWIEDPKQNPYLPDHLKGRFTAGLSRILGPMGTVVLLRELQRLKLVSNPTLVPFGFVPSGRLLRKLELDDYRRSGHESAQIYRRIQEVARAEYPEELQNWFDIPFLAGLSN